MKGNPPLETKRGDSDENCENCLWMLLHGTLEACGCDSLGRVRDEANMGLRGDGLIAGARVACGVG